MTSVQLVQRDRTRGAGPPPEPHLLLSIGVGGAGWLRDDDRQRGGPVMTLYLILAGLPMLGMLGTGAWFFLSVNLAKVPLSAGLGLISWSSLAMDALLVPAMLLGGLVGVLTVRRIGQRTFEPAALGLGLVTALLLVVDT
jgi:uncharacterized membrane protein YfcA